MKNKPQTGTQLAGKDWQTFSQAIEHSNPVERERAITSLVDYLKRENKLDSFTGVLEQIGEIVGQRSASS